MQPSAYRTIPARSVQLAPGDRQPARPRAISGIGHSVASVNGSLPPSGNAIASSSDRRKSAADHRRRAGRAPAAIAPLADVRAERVRGAPAVPRTAPRPGSRARVSTPAHGASHGRRRWSASAVAIAGSRPNANASRPVNRFVAVPAAEPQRPEPRVLAEVAARERLEQGGRAGRRDPGRELRREQRRDRREQDAVAGDVVAGVPPVVPDPEALRPEQLRPEQVRREVEARRRDDHVHEREQRRRAAVGAIALSAAM